jgi:GT2 family glycosyltransferase
MISIVLPYWDRRNATLEALDLLAKHYVGIEVVIVDDGSQPSQAFEVVKDYPFALHVIKLPIKDQPQNPCVPINVGVKASRFDVVVISNPEILHETPVLLEMYKELSEMGEMGYVLAACWCEEEKQWHCHSSIEKRSDGHSFQYGTGYHFCGMLNKSLFYKAGGFDEDYRDGAGWDDPDWVNRLVKAGARFKIRDDLVVKHPKRGCSTNWRGGMMERNQELYRKKWPTVPTYSQSVA